MIWCSAFYQNDDKEAIYITAKLINFNNKLNNITFQELPFMVCMSYLLQVHRFMVIYIGLVIWSMMPFISWLSLLVCCLLNKSYFMDGKTKMDFCCLQNTSSLYLKRFSRLVAVEPHVTLSDVCAAVTITCVCHFATEDSQKQKLHASDYLDTTLILKCLLDSLIYMESVTFKSWLRVIIFCWIYLDV